MPFCSLIKGIAPKIRNPNKQRVFSFFFVFFNLLFVWMKMMDVWVSLGRRKHHDSQQNRVNKKKKYHERGEYSESIITARSAGALVFSNQLTIKGNTSEQRINRRL